MLHFLCCVIINDISIVLSLFPCGSCIIWRVFIIVKSSEELVRDRSLRLLYLFQVSSMTINDTITAFPWLANDLAYVDHALVCILHLGLLGLDNAMPARVVDHYKIVSFFYDVHRFIN